MTTILNTLFERKTLSRSEAKQALLEICNGHINPSQISAFITVFLLRPVAAEELCGFRDALLESGSKIDLSAFNPMDICGTGGDNKNTFNISTISAFIVAGAGIKVAKHGNYSVSSICGSSDLLQHFGYRFSNSNSILSNELQKSGITFLHAPLFQKGLAHVALIRKELRVKTFFNMLGPLINPCLPKVQLLGVYNSDLADLYDIILRQTDINYMIVHSLDGYDEISLTDDCKIISIDGTKVYSPEQMSFQKISASSLHGGSDVEDSAGIFKIIINGNGTKEQNAVVIVNAAAAIYCYYPHYSFEDCLLMASESLHAKKALNCFKSLTGN